ncbi:nucleotidyltransferase domain-containing protein [bacterium]|nr:nucleotidyltransferase domain-containing protein [bacterium]
MTTFNIEKARQKIRDKQRQEKEKRQKLLKKALADFDNIIKMLIEKYNPKRIYQWGSLLNTSNFSEISDIDIAVEGIKSAEEYFNMLGDAMELTNFPVHLEELEKLKSIYADTIKEEGKLIYERK